MVAGSYQTGSISRSRGTQDPPSLSPVALTMTTPTESMAIPAMFSMMAARYTTWLAMASSGVPRSSVPRGAEHHLHPRPVVLGGHGAKLSHHHSLGLQSLHQGLEHGEVGRDGDRGGGGGAGTGGSGWGRRGCTIPRHTLLGPDRIGCRGHEYRAHQGTTTLRSRDDAHPAPGETYHQKAQSQGQERAPSSSRAEHHSPPCPSGAPCRTFLGVCLYHVHKRATGTVASNAWIKTSASRDCGNSTWPMPSRCWPTPCGRGASRADAEDLVIETFLTLWRRLDGFLTPVFPGFWQ